MSRLIKALSFVPVIGLTIACEGRESSDQTAAAVNCDDPHVRQIVQAFGERLARVSLLAPDSVVVREIREAYTPYATPELLERWASAPRTAPGREVSSPWPERIEIRAVREADARSCRVEGDVVYASSAAGENGATRTPVTVVVRRQNEDWRISSYSAQALSADSTNPATAADVIRHYYAAINARQFDSAYAMWSGGQQTQPDFAAEFAGAQRVDVDVGEPGRLEGAAGSQYMKVPVIIRVVTSRGETRRYEGSYTLRRGVADGATPRQRQWHIYSADLAPAR